MMRGRAVRRVPERSMEVEAVVSYSLIPPDGDKPLPADTSPADEKAFLDEVRAFARGPYAEALALGHNLPQAQADAVAAR